MQHEEMLQSQDLHPPIYTLKNKHLFQIKWKHDYFMMFYNWWAV